MKATGVGISDIGYFDNMLHHDRRRPPEEDGLHAARVGRGGCCSALKRCAASSAATSSTRWTRTSTTSREHFIPLLKAAKERGLIYRVEQCPMPGWTVSDNWHNNIAYTPGAWIALHRICEKHGVGDQFRIHYDPSHAILMGQDTRSIFQ